MNRPRITGLSVEHDAESVVGTATPRLSWQTVTDTSGWLQAEYEVRITPADGDSSSSDWVHSGESVLIPWPAPALTSRERRTVEVRVQGVDGWMSEWSDPVAVEAGLLHEEDWQATFVGPAWDEDLESPQPCPYLRRGFEITKPVTRARLYASVLGVYELELNGIRVGDHVLAPGWTSYHHHLRYDAFDVTPMLRDGANVLGGVVGDGWFRGALVENLRRNRYGTRSGLLCQLEITHVDGSTTIVGTDGSWRRRRGRSAAPACTKARRTTHAWSCAVGRSPASTTRPGSRS